MSIKRLTCVVLCSAGLAVAAAAQHGGGGAYGRIGGHAGSAGGGGFHGSTVSGFSNSPRPTGQRPPMSGTRPVAASSALRGRYPGGQGRRSGPGANGFNGYPRPYRGSRRGGSYFNGPWAGWSGATFIGYPGGLGFDDESNSGGEMADGGNEQAPYADPGQGSYAAAPDPGQQMPMPYPQAPQYPTAPVEETQPPPPVREPEPEEAVTLLFKDGRPAEQIHNYMLTRTTLYVRDQHRREISLADLDVAATKKVNQDAGIDFQLLPESSH